MEDLPFSQDCPSTTRIYFQIFYFFLKVRRDGGFGGRFRSVISKGHEWEIGNALATLLSGLVVLHDDQPNLNAYAMG
jgi:hypothetical protein